MKRIVLLILMILGILDVKGQLTPMKSQFFQNPYLVNSAMAGAAGKAVIFSNYSSQWNKIDGGPVMVSLSASMPVNDKASVGLNIINDKSGLLSKTQAMGSFSYKVPLSENQSLRFGVSLSWAQDRLNYGLTSSAGSSDVGLSRYNDRENYLDGNFGVAYINNSFEAQFSYLNLNQKRAEQLSTVDYSTFYSAVSYRFKIDETFAIKPLFAYRGVRNFDNQYDIAAELIADDLHFYTMYHSNNSFTGGIGYDYMKRVNFGFLYNSEPNTVRGFSGGIFDLVLGYKFK
ncbi:type IX secretion system membrane protein PorP/SprF [Pedobacter nyackensis]|uniref:PorP/SprF family type IX secretion system membrane protein n=1 Tax=Pedobacter nyackensis TaxID=475255 RepID=UPI00292EB0B0|nr:type IX secretion system membrane protein PorP/SprF [Pedobacter nyackensis]